MPKNQSRKRGGGKLTRTETVTVRMDPQLRYLAELAARKQRRTLSSFIEWAIEDSLRGINLRDGTGFENYDTNIIEDAANLWDVDDADRFARLAFRYPEMLTHDEQVRWKLIKEIDFLWEGKSSLDKWQWEVSEETLRLDRLREHWVTVKAVSAGDLDRSALPNLFDFPDHIP